MATENPLDQAGTTAVYRLYDSSDRLLYVGIASDPLRRWGQHAKQTTWWSSVTATRLEWFETRKAAELAEKEAIQQEEPRFNLLHTLHRGYSIDEVRQNFRRHIEAASKRGEITIITRHGRPVGGMVPVEWYRRAREALGEPVGWKFAPPPPRPTDESVE